MSTEFWAIVGVGMSVFLFGVACLALGWLAYSSLRKDVSSVDRRLAAVDRRLATIEGWMQGRFREGEAMP